MWVASTLPNRIDLDINKVFHCWGGESGGAKDQGIRLKMFQPVGTRPGYLPEIKGFIFLSKRCCRCSNSGRKVW